MISSNICITQFYTENILYGPYSEDINRLYAKKHGYNYFVEKNSDKIRHVLNGRAPTWYKPKLILEAFELYNPEYVLFMDMDAVVVDHSQKIEEYIDTNFDMIITQDYSTHCKMNAGVFIIKNTPWTKMFLNLWWHSAELLTGRSAPDLTFSDEYLDKLGIFKNTLWHDQTCLNTLYTNMDEVRERIKIIEYDKLNWKEYSGNNNFIFHAFCYGGEQYRTIDVVHEKLLNNTSETDSQHRPTLSELAKKYPSDKDFTHNYFNSAYEQYFAPIRDTTKLICEVGIGGFGGDIGWVPGNSLKIMRDYFPNAELLGLDIKNYEITDLDRIRIDYLDQSNIIQLKKYAKNLNEYDIIIDDGSHNVYDQQITFAEFFKCVRSGGLYIIEDLHSSIEVNDPDKAKLWGWGEPGFITPLQMLKHFKETGKIISDFLTEEHKIYLENNIKSIEIFELKVDSITSVITKV